MFFFSRDSLCFLFSLSSLSFLVYFLPLLSRSHLSLLFMVLASPLMKSIHTTIPVPH